MADTNGQGPPWTSVSANELVEQLAHQVADQAVEMAAMRLYIAKLQAQIDQTQVPYEVTT